MPEVVNTTFLENTLDEQADATRATAIGIHGVSMVFNMASQQLNSLKEYAIAAARRELRFKEFRALDNISFDIKRGDVFGIVGTNGSGKSTLLKIIAGVLEPTEGTCTISGSIAPLIELGAGFDLELTARENIYLNGALLGYSHAYIDEHFDEIVDFAEISNFLDMPMKNYSSGMVARVAFAVATVVVPDILIVDEVLSVGDFMFQQKCERKIESLIKDHQVTVLIVSHSTDQIERLCNKAVWIEKGHLRAIGDAARVGQLYRMLGGHSGSNEAEELVYSVMQLPDIDDLDNIVETIAGDDRYGSAVKIYMQSSFADPSYVTETLILAPGQQESLCMLGNYLSNQLEAPLLLVKEQSIPDIVERTLEGIDPQQIILLGGESFLSPALEAKIRTLKPASEILRITGDTPHDVAINAYETFDNTGHVALLTWDGCTGDILSLQPYALPLQSHLFYLRENGIIDGKLREILESGHFTTLLAVGNEEPLPNSLLDSLPKELTIERICGKNPTHANRLINEWIKQHGDTTSTDVVVLSAVNWTDCLTLSTYLRDHPAQVLFEDVNDLDSIASAVTAVAHVPSGHKLTFIGDDTLFTPMDKMLLAKNYTHKANA